MKRYDFDEIIERRGSGALKTDALQERYGRSDLTGLWVADMDFRTPDFILDALKRRLEHPILGYTVELADYRPAITDWLRSRQGWKVRPEWLTYIPGIVKGIGFVIQRFLRPGDKVIIQTPVYHPFRLVPEGNGLEIVENPLKMREDGLYDMDFENLENVADDKCRLLILSNPHNPAGIVWNSEALKRLARFCFRKGILVISDEIHADMTLFGHRHIPFASVSEDAVRCSITFGAPSKTFNIPGIVSSYAVVPDDDLRDKFYSWLTANEFNDAPIMSQIATVAAYRKGEEWRREMLAYIEENVRFVEEYCAKVLSGIRAVRPEASFLIWLDCRGLGLDHDGLVNLFVGDARLALNDGEMFGAPGAGFMRLNVAAPRSVLRDALFRLGKSVEKLGRK